MNNFFLYDIMYMVGFFFFNKLKFFDVYIVCYLVNFNLLLVVIESFEIVKMDLWKIVIIVNLKV